MKPTQYVVVHSPGPAWQAGVPLFEQEGIRLHVAHYGALREEGKLVSGGPFLDAASGGMMIAAPGVEEDALRAFAAADPTVASGLLAFEVRPWLVGLPARIDRAADHPLETWHRLVRTQDPAGLHALLAEDAVFHSPVVHTPQRGRAIAEKYLRAAFEVFFNPTFRYVREIVGASDAVLEFETEIDGVLVNGVDLITWNDDGRIVAFKVMLRPLKAIDVVRQRMAAMLQAG